MSAHALREAALVEADRTRVVPRVTGALRKECAILATKCTCSARREWNMGFQCRRVLRVHMAENGKALHEDIIHLFWSERDGSEDDSEVDEVSEDAEEAVRGAGCEVAENPADTGVIMPRRDQG
jgi:hypothetical protein